MMQQLDRWTAQREGDMISRFSVALKLVQRIIPHAVEEDLGSWIQNLEGHVLVLGLRVL